MRSMPRDRQGGASGEPRLPLSRERVLQAAMALADSGGIEALTMRRLGQELGVEAMSLYNHVANKDDILIGIVEMALSEIALPSGEAGWQAAVRQSAISTRDVHVRHPWVSSLRMSVRGGGPARAQQEEWLLRTLREAGFSKELTFHALHILQSYIQGFTHLQLSFPYQGEELAGIATKFLQRLPADEYPYFTEHVRQHLEPRQGEEGGFELGLDLILDGLERMRASI